MPDIEQALQYIQASGLRKALLTQYCTLEIMLNKSKIKCQIELPYVTTMIYRRDTELVQKIENSVREFLKDKLSNNLRSYVLRIELNKETYNMTIIERTL